MRCSVFVDSATCKAILIASETTKPGFKASSPFQHSIFKTLSPDWQLSPFSASLPVAGSYRTADMIRPLIRRDVELSFRFVIRRLRDESSTAVFIFDTASARAGLVATRF